METLQSEHLKSSCYIKLPKCCSNLKDNQGINETLMGSFYNINKWLTTTYLYDLLPINSISGKNLQQ